MKLKNSREFLVRKYCFRALFISTLAIVSSGCHRIHYAATSPMNPEDTGHFILAKAPTPSRIQISNFEIGEVDTQYPEKEKGLFRQTNATFIANVFQEQLGKRQEFSEVTRVKTAQPDVTDYVVTGKYDYFERLGTQGREWIPFAGLFGASINEATCKGKLSLTIVKSKNEKVIFDEIFPEEHSEKTSVYTKALTACLQADQVGRITSAIVKAISDDRNK
jgi:hypothetical protein